MEGGCIWTRSSLRGEFGGDGEERTAISSRGSNMDDYRTVGRLVGAFNW
jgi:hypothetical protein